MPVFNVLTINNKQIAKVKAAKQNLEVDKVESNLVEQFNNWFQYISNELKTTKSTLSIKVRHI